MFRIVIWMATLGCLFADQVTGYLLYESTISEAGLLSPSQVSRLFVFVCFAFFVIFSRPYFGSKVLCLLGACLVLTELLTVFRGGDLQGLVYGLLVVAKILFLPLTVFFGLRASKAQNIGRAIEPALLIMFFATSILIWTYSVLEIGAATYPQGDGTKGYFASGNAIGLGLGVGIIWLTVKLRGVSPILRLLSIVFCTSALLQVETKTSGIMSVVAILFYAYSERGRFGIFFRLISLAVLSIGIVYALDNFTEVKRRFEHTDSLTTFLLSHRNENIAAAFDEVSEGGSVVQVLLGGGAFRSYRLPSSDSHFDTLEQDWADIYFFYGVVGLIAYFWFFYWLFSQCRGHPGALLVWFVLFAHSCLAGHIMLNGFLAIAGGLVLASLVSRTPMTRRKISTKIDTVRGQEKADAICG